MLRWCTCKDLFADGQPRDKINVMAVHAARDIEANEELFIHYGAGYRHRNWSEGSAAKLRKCEAQPPCEAMRGYVPADGWQYA